MAEQHGRGLAADAGDARDVVHRITAQREVVRDLVRMHAQPGLDPRGAPALAAGVVPLLVVRDQQLRQVLVRRHDHAAVAFAARKHQGAADEVVGLVFDVREHRQPEGHAQCLAIGELPFQVLRRGIAVGLVGRIQRIAETGIQRFVEGDGDVPRPLALEQVEQEAGEAMHRVRGPSIGVAEGIGRHRVPCTEHVEAGVDQMERGRRGGAHAGGVQVRSRAAGSGRSRSPVASPGGVPTWMKPAMRSCPDSPSRRRTSGS